MTKLSIDRELSKAKSLKKRGEIQKAQRVYQKILSVFPSNNRAIQGLMDLDKASIEPATEVETPPEISLLFKFYEDHNYKAVIELASEVVKRKPKAFSAWQILGVASAQEGNLNVAINAFETAVGLCPNNANAHNNLGNILQTKGNLAEAIISYQTAIKLDNSLHSAHNNLGNALYLQGRLEEAEVALNSAISLEPDYSVALNNLGNVLKAKGLDQKAEVSYRAAINLKPNYFDALNNLGNLLKDQGRLSSSVAAFEKALSIRPKDAGVLNNLGIALKDQNKLEQAISAFSNSLMVDPEYVKAHRNLSRLIEYSEESEQVLCVRDLLTKNNLSANDKCELHFAYAKMMEDLGNFRSAYEHLVQAGSIRKKLLGYDLDQDKKLFSQIKDASLNLEKLGDKYLFDGVRNTPIFVLGMPRSGTTLVEQIISSHSLVEGAGELPFLDSAARKLISGELPLDFRNLNKVRTQYLGGLAKVSNGKKFVTDKMPQNFRYIGLISSVIPEARIIHVKRKPEATCWSNFKHYFSSNGLGYSYDLSDVVAYFHLYEDLMEFWEGRETNNIYHLDYDLLTTDFENETTKLIKFLGLAWEEQCLSPHENQRSVRTVSQQQVRKKVYKGSSNEWMKFEPFLNGIFDIFKHR